MWRRLSEEEKTTLMANYKAGAYVVRFLMGFWLIFVSLVYLEGIKTSIESILAQKYLEGIGPMIAGIVLGLFFYGIPIHFIRTTGAEEIKALKHDMVFLGSAIYVDGGQSFRGRIRGRRSRRYAIVKLVDEWGAGRQIQCRAIGALKRTCREGDRITVLKVVSDKGEEIIAMKKKLI